MGLFDLFRKKQQTVWDALQSSPEFRKQKELFEAMSLLCADGIDADELPNGYGEFGLEKTNPVPTKTVFGSTSYLARLRATDGTKVEYERIGSVSSEVSPHPIDAYEIRHPKDGKLAVLYLSPYQKKNSSRVPSGFRAHPNRNDEYRG